MTEDVCRQVDDRWRLDTGELNDSEKDIVKMVETTVQLESQQCSPRAAGALKEHGLKEYHEGDISFLRSDPMNETTPHL